MQRNSKEFSLCFFSATLQPNLEAVLSSISPNSEKIFIGIKNSCVSHIEQKIEYVGREDGKIFSLQNLFMNGYKAPVLVFVQSRNRAIELFEEMKEEPISLAMIHSQIPNEKRDEIVKEFRLGSKTMLICTDLMARGIDFKGIQTIVNFDFPCSIIQYIHRVGRSGRAGMTGTSLTYVTKKDLPFIRTLVNVIIKSVI